VTSMASCSVMSGRMCANARAMTVLPPPGSPESRTLWPPAAAMVSALLMFSSPYMWSNVMSWDESDCGLLLARGSFGIGFLYERLSSPMQNFVSW